MTGKANFQAFHFLELARQTHRQAMIRLFEQVQIDFFDQEKSLGYGLYGNIQTTWFMG
jgi:hypothetical protein